MYYLNYPALPASVGHCPDRAMKQGSNSKRICCTVLPFQYRAGKINNNMFILHINTALKVNQTDDDIKKIHLLYVAGTLQWSPVYPLVYITGSIIKSLQKKTKQEYGTKDVK